MIKQVEPVSARLKQIMDEREMRQTDLSEITGIHKGTINHYLKGTYTPKNKHLAALAHALQVSELWLMGLDVPKDGQLPELSPEAEQIGRAFDAMNEDQKDLMRRAFGLV